MSDYIDGFVFPISRDHLDEYQLLSAAVAEVWKEHGALNYWEYVGDDMSLAGTRSFNEIDAITEDEVMVFGCVVFESRLARDLANEKVSADPRMIALLEPSASGFDAQRMFFGGFRPLVGSAG